MSLSEVVPRELRGDQVGESWVTLRVQAAGAAVRPQDPATLWSGERRFRIGAAGCQKERWQRHYHGQLDNWPRRMSHTNSRPVAAGPLTNRYSQHRFPNQ